MSLFDDLLTKAQPTTKSEDSSGSTVSSGSNNFPAGNTGGTIQQDPIIVMSESESIGTEEIVLNKPPVAPEVITVPPIITPIETDNSVILSSTSSFGDLPIIINSAQTTDAVSVNNTIEEKIESPVEVLPKKIENNNSPLFDMISQFENKNTPISTETENIIEEFIPEETPIGQVASKESPIEIKFNDTAEYIDHAILEVETLMQNLEITNIAKIEERDSYKKQKEEFAELEKNAEKEHQNMLKEKSHALEVKNYLENEKTGKMNTKHEKTKNKTSAANEDTFELAA